MFSASLFDASSAYGFAFVSAYLSANSLSSSTSLLPVMSNFSLFTTYFSGWNLGVSGGTTLLLNSLSLALEANPPVEAWLTTVVRTLPSLVTSTVTVAFIAS